MGNSDGLAKAATRAIQVIALCTVVGFGMGVAVGWFIWG